jgi:diacylglycerol O-acyltransferase
MNKLSLLDLAFFVAESEASPKHVGGLMIYKRPARSPASFVADLYQELLAFDDVQAPFNRIIHFSLTGMPTWQESEAVDLEQHLFFHKLRRGKNGRQELYQLVSELHQPMLERSRPLWELHLIEGLSERRFAIYVKMHHASADGVTMVRWAADSLASSASDLELRPLWSTPRGPADKKQKRLKER